MNAANDTLSATSTPAQDSSDRQPPRVLCVDDDPNISEAIARSLHRHGIQVLRAYHGMQGLWEAITAKPDVIVLDLVMPHGRGEEIIECLKRNPQTAGIPVIVLTAKTEQGLDRLLHKMGACRFFTKPIPFDDLFAEIGRHICIPNG